MELPPEVEQLLADPSRLTKNKPKALRPNEMMIIGGRPSDRQLARTLTALARQNQSIPVLVHSPERYAAPVETEPAQALVKLINDNVIKK